MKYLRLPIFAAIVSYASPVLAGVEIEFSAGPSSKVLEDEESEEKSTITSADVSLAVAYRFGKYVSFGLISSYKDYDLKESAESLSIYADDFYSDPENFPGTGALREESTASGSSKGIVFGPQLTLAYPGKYFQPYLRVAYQLGTLKTVHEYETSGTYVGNSLVYDVKIEEDRKTSFTQYGLGFRIPMGKTFYFLADAGIEQISFTSDDAKFSVTGSFDGESFEGSATNPETIEDKGGGTILKIGVGAAF